MFIAKVEVEVKAKPKNKCFIILLRSKLILSLKINLPNYIKNLEF